MNVVVWDLRRNLKTVIAWTVIIVALQFMYAAIYPSFLGEKELMLRWTKMMPQALMKFFGFDTLDLTNILNYYAAISSFYVNLIGSIFVVFVGARAISREEELKTAEFLLTKPLSRRAVFFLKLFSSFLQVLIFDAAMGIFSFLFLNLYKTSPFEPALYWRIWIAQLLLHFTIMNVSFFVGAVSRSPQPVLFVAFAAMAGLFVLNSMSKMIEVLKKFGMLSPYYYAEPSKLLTGSISLPSAAVYFLVLNLTLIVFGLLAYSHRDVLI